MYGDVAAGFAAIICSGNMHSPAVKEGKNDSTIYRRCDKIIRALNGSFLAVIFEDLPLCIHLVLLRMYGALGDELVAFSIPPITTCNPCCPPAVH